MSGDAINGWNGCGARAGARTLNLLAAPLNSQILRTLQEGAGKQADLRRETGHPAQTTLRAQLRKLEQAEVIEKRRRNSFPGVLEYELSEAGRDLLPVMSALDHWLDQASEGPHELGSSPAKAAIRALTEAWSTTMLRGLTAKPLTLTELDHVISSLNFPSLGRRLSSLRLAGLVESREGEGRGTPYRVTAWARAGVAPLLAASRWERRHAPVETSPIAKLDVETAFLLAAGLLAPSDEASGSCRLTVELRDNGEPRLAGVLLEVREGRIASCTTRLEGRPDAWVAGSLSAWLAALIDRDRDGLERGGDGELARVLVEGMHAKLFAIPVA